MRKEMVVTPATIYIAFECLFLQKEYMLAVEKAQILYNGICDMLGLAKEQIIVFQEPIEI